jgi:hypothetical protein
MTEIERKALNRRLLWILGAVGLVALGVAVSPLHAIFTINDEPQAAPPPIAKQVIAVSDEELKNAALAGRPDPTQAKAYEDGVVLPGGAYTEVPCVEPCSVPCAPQGGWRTWRIWRPRTWFRRW